MKMKAFFLSGLTLVYGASGIVLRRIELSASFDSAGLPVYSSVTWILLALSALFVLIAAFGAKNKIETADSFTDTFRSSALHTCISAAAGFALLVGAGAQAYGALSSPDNGVIQILMPLFGLVCAVCWIILALSLRKRRDPERLFLAAAVPAVYCCIWLVTAYKTAATNPVLLDFVYLVLGIASATLGFYGIACYAFGRKRPFSATFFSRCGAYFCMVAMADADSIGTLLCLVWATVSLLMFSHSLNAGASTLQAESVAPEAKTVG